MTASSPPEAALRHLLLVMAKLRDPVSGCPWDQVQDFSSIAPYTVEEAFEVAGAIRAGPDFPALLDELGDPLPQVVDHAGVAAGAGGPARARSRARFGAGRISLRFWPSWAICCSRWCTTPGWPKRPGGSTSRPWPG